MRKFTKRRTALVAGAATLLAGGAAYAYWTTGGDGTGEATTGTSAEESVTVVQTSVVEGMGPGIAAQTLSGTFDNPNEVPVYVTTVTARIVGVVEAEEAPEDGYTCDVSDFVLTEPVMQVGTEAAVDDTTQWSGATLAFNNKAETNQNACKGATVNLAYTVS